MQILPASQRTSMPWRNGAGVTQEVSVSRAPAADGVSAAWRISIATIDRPAEFSAYPGVERHLMPLGPDGLCLLIDGIRAVLPQFEVLTFDGLTPVAVTSVPAVCSDLNLMVTRDCIGTLVKVPVDARFTAHAERDEIVVLVVVEGAFTAFTESDAGVNDTLALHDALELRDGESVTLAGVGSVALARVLTRMPGWLDEIATIERQGNAAE